MEPLLHGACVFARMRRQLAVDRCSAVRVPAAVPMHARTEAGCAVLCCSWVDTVEAAGCATGLA